MCAHVLRRHDERRRFHRALAWPAWILLGCCGLALADPDPGPAEVGTPPSAADPAPDPRHPDDRLLDRPAESPPPPDPAPADRTSRDKPIVAKPAAAPTVAAPRPASPAGLKSAPAESADDSDASREAEFRTRRSLNHVLYRDRRYRLLLDQAGSALTTGDSLTAFDRLLELTTAAEDVFLWNEAAARPVSVQQSACELLSRLPTPDRERWERYIGATARGELDAAKAAGRVGQLQTVAQRYPGTSAGIEALRFVAVHHFDRGDMIVAARHWRRLIAVGGITWLSDRDRLRAALAARSAGDEELLGELQAASQRPISIGAANHSLSTWLDLHPATLTAGVESGGSNSPHWTTPHGAVAGNRHAVGSLPYHIPVWSVRVHSDSTKGGIDAANSPAATLRPDGDRRLENDPGISEWVRQCVDREEIPATASTPVVIGDTIIARASRCITARRLTTGELLWEHPCASDLSGGPAYGEPTPFSQTSAENALLLSMSADGQRLYFVDEITELVSDLPTPVVDGGERTDDDDRPQGPLVNRLIALELDHDVADTRSRGPGRRRIAWSTSLEADDHDEGAALEGHFFLGAPLPVDDLLLAITERAGQVNLVALDAATGRLRFQQGLALVDRPLTVDSDRLRLCLMPAYRDGLAVVPTPCGALVAFDLTQRTLRWTAQYRALDTAVSTNWRGDGREHAALHPVQPVFAGSRILLLPADSTELLAFEVDDGRLAWSTPRRGGAQVCVSDQNHVVLASAEHITRLDLATGQQHWRVSVGPLAGRGVLLGDAFLAPRTDGGLMAIDLESGLGPTGGPEILSVAARVGDATAPLLSTALDSSRSAESPAAIGGNLLTCGECLISSAPQRTAVLMQSQPLRELLEPSLRQAAVADSSPWSEIGDGWTTAERLGHLAELAMTLRETEAACRHWETLLTLDGSEEVPTADRDRARNLLRELTHWQLHDNFAADSTVLLARLAALNVTDIDHARWRVAVLRDAARRGDVPAWIDAAHELARSPADLLVPDDVARRHQLHPAAILDESRRQLLACSNSSTVEQLATATLRTWQDVKPTNDAEQLEQFVRVFGVGLPVNRARRQLASLNEHAGRRLAAEAWLLDIPSETGGAFEQSVQRQLLALERRRRPPAKSGIVLTAAVQEFTPRPRGPRLTPLASPHPSPAVAYAGGEIPFGVDTDWLRGDGPRAEISVQAIDADFPLTLPNLTLLAETRRDWQRDADSTLRILNLGDPRLSTASMPLGVHVAPAPDAAPQVELAVVQRESTEVQARIILPERTRESALHFQPAHGNFLAVADRDLHGLSLLDGTRLWTAQAREGDRSERLRLGPSGPNFCIVQMASGLACVDPVSGAVRWQRRDIAPDCGLLANEESGVFGDERCLVVVGADQRACRIVDTRTGSIVREDVLPTTDIRRTRLAFGCRVFVVTGGDVEPRFRLWDGATGDLLVDEPATYPVRMSRVDRDHVAYLAGSHELVVLNATRGEPVLTRKLSAEEVATLTGFSVVRDRDCWYVQTTHAGVGGGTRSEHVTSDVKVPCVTMSGRVHAYSVAEPTRRLWTRDFDNRTLLLETRRSLPILVMLHRTREDVGTSDRCVTVEVIDKWTGQLVTRSTDWDQSRILHAGHDARGSQYNLYSETSLLTVHYTTRAQQPVFAAETSLPD